MTPRTPRRAAAARWVGIVGTGTIAAVLLRGSRRTGDAVDGAGSDRVVSAPEAEPPGVAVAEASEGAPAEGGRAGGMLRLILSDYKTLASLTGVLIYGVVRVAYDAFYTRLGVFPEAVGLSETTILGRAALYLAITVSIGVVVGGAWLLAVDSQLKHASDRAGARRRLLLGSLSLTVLCGALFAVGEQIRSLLGSLRLVYYCLERCKFNTLNAETLERIRTTVTAAGSERDYSVATIGPAWLVLIPLGVLLLATTLGLVWTRRARTEGHTARAGTLFALFAVGSITAGLAAPLVVKVTTAAASVADGSEDPSFIDAHAEFARWILIALPLLAVALGLLATLTLVVGPQPLRSPWVFASFVAVFPLLLGLFEPQVLLFIEEQGLAALATAVLLIAALVALCFLLARDRRERRGRWSPSLAVVVAAVVWSMLFLAWERGLNLGAQAAVGDQIYPKRFSLLSVRSSVVCLLSTQKDARPPRTPFVYLGQVGGTLVLYDYRRDIGADVPESFPVRMPASNVDLQLAELRAGIGWTCPRSG